MLAVVVAVVVIAVVVPGLTAVLVVTVAGIVSCVEESWEPNGTHPFIRLEFQHSTAAVIPRSFRVAHTTFQGPMS
jgi:hypothetical protein